MMQHKRFTLNSLVAALAFAPLLGHAAASLQSVSVSPQDGGRELHFLFNKPLSELPQGFMIEKPASLVLDLDGATSALATPMLDIHGDAVDKIRVIETDTRLRAVVRLAKPSAYTARLQGNELIVKLAGEPLPNLPGNGASEPARAEQALAAEPAAEAASASVASVAKTAAASVAATMPSQAVVAAAAPSASAATFVPVQHAAESTPAIPVAAADAPVAAPAPVAKSALTLTATAAPATAKAAPASASQPVGVRTEVASLAAPVPAVPEVPSKAASSSKPKIDQIAVPKAPSAKMAVASAKGGATAPLERVQKVEFSKGSNGEGRLILELPASAGTPEFKATADTVTIDVPNVRSPIYVSGDDVSGLNTPVQAIKSETLPGGIARLTLQNTGVWEHSAYQMDRQLVVEVRAKEGVKSADGTRASALVSAPAKKYTGDKLSLNFQDIDVRALLQVIADFTEFNMVTSDTVQGTLTLRLKDVPWDQALDIVLEAKGLGTKRNGAVIWIAPKEELAAKEKAELDAKASISDVEPLKTIGFALNYAKATDVIGALSGTAAPGGSGGGASTRILSKRGSVIADARTNQLFVTDVSKVLPEVEALIKKIDIPVRQVMIEAQIVEADDSFSRSLGAKFGMSQTGGYGTGSKSVAISGSYKGVGEQTGQRLVDTTTSYEPDTQLVALGASGINGFNPAAMAMSFFGKGMSKFINLELSALEAKGKGKVLSSPRIVTADQVKASIEQGTQLPYQVTSNNTTTIMFQKADLKLEVTPQITPEGNVIMDVEVAKDTIGQQTTAGYAIDTKHVKTQVLVQDDGTVVIGGIYEETKREDVTSVPFLGDIPVLGNLFRNKTTNTQKTELLVFLTPHVIANAMNFQAISKDPKINGQRVHTTLDDEE